MIASKLSNRKIVLPVIPKSVTTRALQSINKQLVDRGYKRNYKLGYESAYRSPMHYSKLLCYRCYNEITSELVCSGGRKKYYHIKCAMEVNMF